MYIDNHVFYSEHRISCRVLIIIEFFYKSDYFIISIGFPSGISSTPLVQLCIDKTFVLY